MMFIKPLQSGTMAFVLMLTIHYRKGSLRFKAIMPCPQSVELQIRLTGEVAPRSCQWFLKGARNGN